MLSQQKMKRNFHKNMGCSHFSAAALNLFARSDPCTATAGAKETTNWNLQCELRTTPVGEWHCRSRRKCLHFRIFRRKITIYCLRQCGFAMQNHREGRCPSPTVGAPVNQQTAIYHSGSGYLVSCIRLISRLTCRGRRCRRRRLPGPAPGRHPGASCTSGSYRRRSWGSCPQRKCTGAPYAGPCWP